MTSYSYQIHLPDDFYSRYWQREPLMIRQAIANFRSPLDGDDLAGLACFDEVESRIVLQPGGTSSWEVRHGPFRDEHFTSLPETHWTLLVQAVDHWHDEVMALRPMFPAIPNWRVDDVMVSYATDGGGVGPHADNYDVFLLQGAGRRRWRLGGPVSADAELQSDTELRLLSNFETQQEYLLEPGDMLYLPPSTAHWGISEDQCITYSIGFRAPAIGEMLDAAVAEIAHHIPNEKRYRDPPPVALTMDHPGEITSDVIKQLHNMFVEQLTPEAVAKWFGGFATQRKYPAEEPNSNQPEAAPGTTFRPRSDSRFAFILRDNALDLFVDGNRFVCPLEAEDFVRRLCDGVVLTKSDVSNWREIVFELLCHSALESD